MNRLLQICSMLGLTAALGLAAADKKPPREPRERAVPPPRAGGEPRMRPPAAERKNPSAAPGGPIQRWNQMSPEQREKELQKLPPKRQEVIRQRLEQYNRLTQGQKNLVGRFNNL